MLYKYIYYNHNYKHIFFIYYISSRIFSNKLKTFILFTKYSPIQFIILFFNPIRKLL